MSDLVGLAYATEAKEVGALCAAARRTKPAASVIKVIAQCEKQLAVVDQAIAAVAKPQAAYAKALAKRDALFPERYDARSSRRFVFPDPGGPTTS